MLKTVRLTVFACLFAAHGWGCSSCDSKSATPGENWPTAPAESQGFDSSELAVVVEQIDAQDLPIDSLLLVRNGVLILNAYFYPYLGDRAHDVASVTKSITSTLVGIAADRGLLRIDQKLTDTFPEHVPAPPSNGKQGIELHHLLSMSSGLECGLSAGEPELYEMQASEHWVKYAIELPMAAAPGSAFAYCSPGSHLLSAMVGKASGQSAQEFAKEHLFGPLGIRDFFWPDDPQGENHGWGDLQLYPKDMARIGLLFLREGTWNDRQVVSKDWVHDATRTHVIAADDGTGYGYQWWVLPGPYQGLYEARGRGGQAIVVWPDKDLVVVFTGRGRDVRGDIAPLLVATLKSDDALEPNPKGHTRLLTAIRKAAEAPAPQPVPRLPPMANQISGKVYQLEANSFGVQCISIHFDSPSEVLLRLTVGSDRFDHPIGMDGLPRFSEQGPTATAPGVRGAWSEPTVFTIWYDEVAGPTHLQIRGDFGHDPQTAQLTFTDATAHFPVQSIPAVAVGECPL